ncbi:mitochondrial carrier [Colletotrichum caudatum]|nr:mitochondrial carrier [Colletotrichum caudatum]
MIATSQPSLKINTTQTQRTQPLVHLLTLSRSGGATTSLLTSPLDVLQTQLQSDLYLPSSQSTITTQGPHSHLYSTPLGHNNKGWHGLYLNYKEDDPIVHAHAAVATSIATATATNPIWLVKTRLQLNKSHTIRNTTVRQYKGSLDCIQKVLQKEGIPKLYHRLSASYLGTVETVLHLVLYKKLKVLFQVSTSSAASYAKFATVLVTYLHKVIQTRLHQAPTTNRNPTYTNLGQYFNLV